MAINPEAGSWPQKIMPMQKMVKQYIMARIILPQRPRVCSPCVNMLRVWKVYRVKISCRSNMTCCYKQLPCFNFYASYLAWYLLIYLSRNLYQKAAKWPLLLLRSSSENSTCYYLSNYSKSLSKALNGILLNASR